MDSHQPGIMKPAILIWIWLSATYWAIESSMDCVFFRGGSLLEEIFAPTRQELWMRLLVVFFLFITSLLGLMVYERRRRVEVAIQQEREKSQAYLDVAGVIFVVCDAQQRVKLINRKGCEIFGYREDEIMGRNCFDIFIPEKSKQKLISVFDKLMAGETDLFEYFESPILTKSGEEKTIAWHNALLRDESGDITGILCSGEDITERKQAEEALKASEERYRQLVENASEGIIVAQDGWAKFTNLRTEEFIGYQQEELLSKPFLEFIHPDDREMVIDHHKKRTSGELMPEKYNVRVIHKDGKTRWLEVGGVKITWNGKPASLNFINDITERKLAEEALRESEEKFRCLAEESPNMIYINKGGKVVYANKKCEEIMGYTREEFYSPDFDFMILIAPEYKDSVKQNFVTHMNDEEAAVCEYALITKAGEKIEAIHATKLIKYEGESAILGVVTDIKDLKRAETALRESEEKYSNLFQQSNDAIFIHDLEGNITDVNQKVLHLFGYTKSEILALKIAQLHPPEVQELSREAFKKVAEAGFVNFVIDFKKKNGDTFPAEVSSSLFEIGGLTVVQGVVRDITERNRAEKIQEVHFNIVQATSTADNLEELLEIIHQQLGELIDTTNFYVALYDEKDDTYTFPYHVDENPEEIEHSARPLPKSLTDYVRRTGEPLLVDEKIHQQLIQKGEVELVGKASPLWMGAPLKSPHGVIGVAAVQSYTNESAFDEQDLELLSFVSENIALAIEHKRAEEALQESEAKYRSIVESSRDVIMLTSPKGIITYLSPACEEVLGYRSEELVGKQPWIIHPDDLERVKGAHFKALNGESGSNYEYRIVTKNGKTKWVSHSWTPAMSNGHLQVVVSMVGDITGRKLIEREQEVILNINKLLLGELDTEMAMQNLSIELRELIPHDLLTFTLIHKELDQVEAFFSAPEGEPNLNGVGEMPRPYREAFQGSLTQLILHERRNRLEKIIPEMGTDLDRNLRNLGMNSFISLPLINVGVPLGMLFMASSQEDAFTNRHAELLEQIHLQLVLWIQHHKLIERLSDSEAKFRNLFDNSNDAIYILQGTRFVYINRKFEELLEYKLEEVNKPDFNFMNLVAPESVPLIEERSRRVDAREKLAPNYEFKGLSKSGRIIDFDVNVSYITFDGEPAVQGILRDISERKQFETKERELQIELMQHSKLASIGMLAAGIAHNMNVPLQNISNHLELLKMTRDDIPYLDTMQNQVQRISAIINNMLHKSRQEQDQSKRDIDLNQLLVEELNFLDADLTFKHEVEKEYHFDPDLPTICGIYSDFSQALLNVIKNALDAMYGVRVKKLCVRTEALSDGDILVEVKDSGKGIPQEHLDRIFDPFFSTKPPTSEHKAHEPTGTGLGLSATYQLLKKYQARFEVNSGEGQGTTFRIVFPTSQEATCAEIPKEVKESEPVLEEA